MATVPDLLADAIRRTAPTQARTSVLAAVVSILPARTTDLGVITGAAAVTVDIAGDLFEVNGVLAPFNRSVVSPGVAAGAIVKCDFVNGQLIVADVVVAVGS